MKKKILILVLSVVAGTMVFAQQHSENSRPDKVDRCEAFCHRFSESCCLSDESSEEFGRIYKEYYKELQAIREQYRPERRRDMSDEEVEAQMKGKLERSKKVAELKEKYYDKFAEVLTPRQIARLYDGNQHFRNDEGRFRGHHGDYCDYGERGCPERGYHHHRGCCR